jgi:hypothetical protein
MRIFEHEATVFIGNGIKFGVGNAGINVSHTTATVVTATLLYL